MNPFKRTTFVVADADAAASFYESVFGWTRWYDNTLTADRRFPPTGTGEDAQVHLVILDTANDVLGKLGLLSYPDTPIDSAPPRPTDRVRIGDPVLVVATKDVDGIYERAVAQGATVVTAPVDWEVPAPSGARPIRLRSVSLFDPNGIYLEVSAHPDTD